MTDHIKAAYLDARLKLVRQNLRTARRFEKRRAAQRRAWRERKDGSSGAASECRRIDVDSGEVVGIIDQKPNSQST